MDKTLITGITIGILFAGLAFFPAQQVFGPHLQTGEDISVNAQIKLEGKGAGSCMGSSEDSGTAKAKVKFTLLVQETNEDDYNGIAKVQLTGLNSGCDGIPKKFVNKGPLAFSYDSNSNVMSISGEIKDKERNVYDLNAVGMYDEGKKGKDVIDLNLEVVGLGGVSIDLDFKDISVSWREGCRHCTGF